jgi:hypothetical protein
LAYDINTTPPAGRMPPKFEYLIELLELLLPENRDKQPQVTIKLVIENANRMHKELLADLHELRLAEDKFGAEQ